MRTPALARRVALVRRREIAPTGAKKRRPPRVERSMKDPTSPADAAWIALEEERGRIGDPGNRGRHKTVEGARAEATPDSPAPEPAPSLRSEGPPLDDRPGAAHSRQDDPALAGQVHETAGRTYLRRWAQPSARGLLLPEGTPVLLLAGEHYVLWEDDACTFALCFVRVQRGKHEGARGWAYLALPRARPAAPLTP